jgi:hypothetical protein
VDTETDLVSGRQPCRALISLRFWFSVIRVSEASLVLSGVNLPVSLSLGPYLPAVSVFGFRI